MARLVHASELENEVCQSTKEHNDGEKHSKHVLPSSPECCHNEDDDCDGNSGDGNPFLSIFDVVDNNEKLYGEAQKEEEIKLQQSNVNLYTVRNCTRIEFSLAGSPEKSRNDASFLGPR